jgi:hypothetical protein
MNNNSNSNWKKLTNCDNINVESICQQNSSTSTSTSTSTRSSLPSLHSSFSSPSTNKTTELVQTNIYGSIVGNFGSAMITRNNSRNFVKRNFKSKSTANILDGTLKKFQNNSQQQNKSSGGESKSFSKLQILNHTDIF